MSHQTFVIRVSPSAPQKRFIMTAAEVLRRGGLVAFPTETVYGLGADALNADAVKQIFVAKGRPLDNPIIVHVASASDLDRLTDHVPQQARCLMDRFWPGPLTLILPKSAEVPEEVTAGLDTVAVRMPRNKIALALITALGRPVVTIFGSTDPAWTTIDFAQERIIRVDVPCGPCQKKVCPLKGSNRHQCMRKITPDMVLAAAGELLQSKASPGSSEVRA